MQGVLQVHVHLYQLFDNNFRTSLKRIQSHGSFTIRVTIIHVQRIILNLRRLFVLLFNQS